MENIGNFLSACELFGMKKTDLFQTVDLYEGTNIPQVSRLGVSCLTELMANSAFILVHGS